MSRSFRFNLFYKFTIICRLDDRTEAFLQAIPPVIDGQDPLIVPPAAGLLKSNIFFHFKGFNFINSRFPKIFPEGCTAFPVERGAGRKTEVILSPVKYGGRQERGRARYYGNSHSHFPVPVQG